MADVDELRARDEGWRRSIVARDAEAVLDFLDEDYRLELVQPERSVIHRELWLRTLSDYHVHEWTEEDQVIDVQGDLGVILHRVYMRATVLGADRSGVFVLTDIWRRQDGRWKVWRRHSTPLTAGSLPTTD